MDTGRDQLAVVSCAIAPDKVDELFELLDPDAFAPAARQDLERGTCRVEIYLDDAAKAPAAAEALVRAGALIGVTLAPEFSALARADWANGWKRWFHSEKVSDRIVVRPTWEKYEPKPGEIVLSLDPGMSFGTGRHETTRASLRFLDSLAAEDASRSVLDMGCGTGILSIAARLLGFRDVCAFDIEPDCIESAKANAAVNGVSFAVSLGDCAKPHEPRQIVVANILAPILILSAAPIAASVAPGGRLILAGILAGQYPAVRAAYEAQGLRQLETIVMGEWQAGLFAKGG